MRTQKSRFLQVLFSFMLLASALAYTQVTAWNQLKFPPLPAFNPQQPTRIQLSNGMVIFLQPDHELPLVSVTTRIRGGSISEPAAKVGLVGLYGEVWRTGGTKTKTGDQMDDFLEARAAKIETGDGSDSTSISLNCLKGDFEPVFDMYLDLLRNPEFRGDKLELAKEQAYTGIARRNDDVGSIVGRESADLAYGKDNPYARDEEYATVFAVQREDLVTWHQQYVQPNNIILGVSGDFDPTAMEATLRKAFEAWPKGPQAKDPDVKFTPPKPGYYFVQKTDVNQSTIAMVDLGILRNNPDYFAVSVMNEIFGGGFSSRLFNNVRAAKGLAYSVGGGVGTSFSHPGMTNIRMQTKSETTAAGIDALYEEIDKMQQKAPDADELKRAKDQILNSFIFRFDTPGKVLGEKMAYEFYHYPLDFLERYRNEIDKVTADQVTTVARKYIQKDRLAVLVVGNDAEFDKPLSGLGPVTKLDITIPPPPKALMEQMGQQGPGGQN
jgi:zinc protease